ncbi:MAG: right-handed parallel beta-helix repeat-containing protein [Candidatus Cloacimonadota bacterium]|nr:right-handed parallel beta-helix repeat-containing protein [Candidatus Cloacimonadota bacterium]
MKIRFFLVLISILIAQFIFAITVDGNAYLEAQTDHSGIELNFERISPDSLLYTTYTNTNGYFTIDIESGYYYITYSKYGYLGYNTYENLYSDTTLPDVTLIEHQSLIIVPDDFALIQDAIDYSCWGDTILVQPGIYYENLYINNDQLTIGSLYLTTQDTSYISQTIIDGGNNGSVVEFYNGPDVLVGFTIRNGNAPEFGGGIRCHNADTILSSLIISNNAAADDGGGIYCYSSSPIIENTIISYNNADLGGGIYCEEGSSPQISNVSITSNTGICGAGFYCEDPSEPILENVVISYNNAGGDYSLGGGMYLRSSANPILTNVEISNNSAKSGGGIFCSSHATPYLSSVDIVNNIATSRGGGIFCANYGSIQFDDQNRCNLHSNQISNNRGYGADLALSYDYPFDVILDTFSVSTPTDYYATPIDSLNFDFFYSIQDSLINQDVYVSVDGDNSNTGTSPTEPFKTIKYALSQIQADSLNKNTIHILPGTYSSSTNGEIFPIRASSYVSIAGSSAYEVILDAQNQSSVLRFYNTKDIVLKNLTIQNGSATGISDHGGGLTVYYSEVILENVRISNNYAEDSGGAIFCYESEMLLRNVEISENDNNIDVIYTLNSTIDFINTSIVNNTSYNPVIYSSGYSYLSFQNCILWNNASYNYIVCNNNGQENILTFSYNDLKHGQDCILQNGAATINWLEGNIDEDPLFVGAGEHPFSLQDLSPCVNTGIPDTTGLNLPEYDLAGNPRIYGGRIDMGVYENQNVVVGIDDNLIPLFTKLNKNYPNPFNPTTTISFSIPEESTIELYIYNIKGQKIKTLVSDQFTVGQHSIIWNGDDDFGNSISSGVYLYKLNVNGKTEAVKKCLLLK